MQFSSEVNDGSESRRESSVLFLLNSLSIGGSEKKTISIVNEMRRRGIDVHLAYIDDRAPLIDFVSKEVPLYCLHRNSKFSFSSAWRLRRYLAEHKLKNIFCINLHPLLYALTAVRFLERTRKPRVILFENTTEKVGRKAHLSMVLYRLLMRRAAELVFGCDVQLELWVRRYRLKRQKCRVIYNGIDEKSFDPDATSANNEVTAKHPSKGFVIGSVGNFSKNKNHIELVLLLDRLRHVISNVSLIIIGDGEERGRLEEAASNLGLQDRVALPGRCNDVRPWLETMDVFILPSVSETFSNSVLEAMAMRKPVILNKTGGMPEIVTDRKDGYLYDRGNLEQLEKIVVELKMNEDLRRVVGSRARARIVERFTFDRMVNEYVRLLW